MQIIHAYTHACMICYLHIIKTTLSKTTIKDVVLKIVLFVATEPGVYTHSYYN